MIMAPPGGDFRWIVAECRSYRRNMCRDYRNHHYRDNPGDLYTETQEAAQGEPR